MSAYRSPTIPIDSALPDRWTLSPDKHSWPQRKEPPCASSPKTRQYQAETEEISKRQEEQDPDFGTINSKGKRPATETPNKRRDDAKKRSQNPYSPTAKGTAPSHSPYTKCSATEKAQRDKHIANIADNWGKSPHEILPDELVPRQQIKASSRAPKRILAKNWSTSILEGLEEFSLLSANDCAKAHLALLEVRQSRPTMFGAYPTISESLIRDARKAYSFVAPGVDPTQRTFASPREETAGPSRDRRSLSPSAVDVESLLETFSSNDKSDKGDRIEVTVSPKSHMPSARAEEGEVLALEAHAQKLLTSPTSNDLTLELLDRKIDQAYKMRGLVAKMQLRIHHLDAEISTAQGR
nr:hypothetical protein CFP56_38767 [Quercus suber]